MSEVVIGFKAPKELAKRFDEHVKKNTLAKGPWLCGLLTAALDRVNKTTPKGKK
jgi:hypothetical protein